MKNELLSQDNRATAHPIFAVQQRKRIFGLDQDYSDAFIWVDEEGEEVDAQYREDHQNTIDFTKLYYEDVWQFVQPFFTEKAAIEYLKFNSYNLNQPRVYCYSGYGNHEWQEVRERLMK